MLTLTELDEGLARLDKEFNTKTLYTSKRRILLYGTNRREEKVISGDKVPNFAQMRHTPSFVSGYGVHWMHFLGLFVFRYSVTLSGITLDDTFYVLDCMRSC